ATDLQVLHGLFSGACQRRYHGIPVKTEYGNEIAIRLILGCISVISGRFDIQIIPLFCENDMHYYRTYVKILNKPDSDPKIGYILHCHSCGNRKIVKIQSDSCDVCNAKMQIAGPLWIGNLFDKQFVKSMLDEVSDLRVDKKCEKILQKCVLESQMPGTYYTLDEIASKMKSAPLSLKKAINRLEQNDYLASPTSFNPTGFRTDARIDKIIEVFSA
ncbi:MAG: tRNA (guanine-N1)-methyltransferase, partial [Nitrosopumilaceae archaeon]